MQIYPWDVVQSTILSQALAAGSPIPEQLFDRNFFFAPNTAGTKFSFFKGTIQFLHD
jgi:hypothetical protein